jgi:hypothetical protein
MAKKTVSLRLVRQQDFNKSSVKKELSALEILADNNNFDDVKKVAEYSNMSIQDKKRYSEAILKWGGR